MPTPSAQQRQGDHREVWSRKAVLREVYGHLYRKMTDQCIPGLSIEVGGGSGNMKQLMPNTLSFDIVPEPWLDFVADAQSLPFRTGSVSNILMLDVLHHIEFPLRFFREADRVLRPGGRIVAMEPGITPISHVAYSALHEEPVDMTADPLIDGRPSVGKDPYTGNQAIPTLLVRKFRAQLSERVPALQLRSARWLSLFAYPLSGGFKRWSLLPARAAGPLLRIEDAIEPLLGPLCGFRLLSVYEKLAGPVGA